MFFRDQDENEEMSLRKEHPKISVFEENNGGSQSMAQANGFVVDGEEGSNTNTQSESEIAQRNTIVDDGAATGTTATLNNEIDNGTSEESSSSHNDQILWEEHGETIRTLEPRLSQRDMEERVRRLVGQNASLANQNAALANQNVALTQRVEQAQRTAAAVDGEESLSTKIILAFIAGILGWTPPLWFHLRNFLNCHGVGGGDNNHRNVPDGEDPSTFKEKIIAGLKVAFYFFVFVVDLTDAVLDVAVSFQDILRDLEPTLRWWGVWLLIATITGRTIGGLFAVFYNRIDESDRELSYFIAETTIGWVEDYAAWLYLQVKKIRGIEWTLLDKANHYLTLVCGFLFLGPIFFSCKRITKNYPRRISSVILTLYALQAAWAIINFYILNDFFTNLPIEKRNLSIRLNYSIYVSLQLYLVYHWICYLHQKDKERQQRRRQQHQEEDLETENPILAVEEDDDSGATSQP